MHAQRSWQRFLAFGLMLISTAAVLPETLFAQSEADASRKTGTEREQTQPRNEMITVEEIEELRKQAQQASDLDEESKKRILDTYQQALDKLNDSIRLENQAPADRALVDDVQSRLEAQQQALAESGDPLLDDVSLDSTLPELATALATRQPDLQQAQASLAQLEAESNRIAERRKTIVADQASYASRKAEIEEALQARPPADEPPLLTAARRALHRARLRHIVAEAPAHQAELAKYDAEKAHDLPVLRTQIAKEVVTRLQTEIDELNQRISARRSQDAKYIADQLRKFANGEAVTSPYEAVPGLYENALSEPVLFAGRLTNAEQLERAGETADLANINVTLTDRLSAATRDADDSKTRLDNLRSLQNRVRDKVERVGTTGAVGIELRKQMRFLNDTAVVRRECRLRQEKMHNLEFERLEYEDERSAVAAQIEVLTSLARRSERELRIKKDHHDTLVLLEKNYTDYFDKLGQLDATEQEFIREIELHRSYISEHVLWIRSNSVLNADDVRTALTTFRRFISPSQWADVARTLSKDVGANHRVYFLAGVMVLVLAMLQRRFRSNLAGIGVRAAKATFCEFSPTVRATIITALISLPWPAVMAFAGWRLSSSAADSPFPRAVGAGLIGLAAGLLSLTLVRQICRPLGLGPAHFAWPTEPVRSLRRRISVLMIVLLPLVFVGATLHGLDNPQGADSLERFVLIAALGVLGHFLFRAMHPAQGVFREYLGRHMDGFVFRTRWLWYPAAFGLPLVLAALAVAGYFYTANELQWRLDVMIWLLIALFIVRSFLVRWFVVSHRRMRIEQARQRRAVLAEAAQAAAENTSNIPQPVPQDDQADLAMVGVQTRRLINSGLVLTGFVATWFVWVEVLPALAILDRVELWSTTVEVSVEEVMPDGTRTQRTVPQVEPVTVRTLLKAIVFAIVTITASRNVPGLIGIVLLQRLPLEPSIRYAVRMVSRHVILIVGVIFTFGALGVGWSRVQWLAAALTVGLGFGLQEIFANFVSGLIILFERPVRIGDVVTIDGVSGSVSRIQIRATTITDWDRKEYIVPNREFVTGRLLNWTLSDRTNRIVINVGVAYGSDTLLARSLLLQVARKHPAILDDPAPIATFEGFGDSTLDLILRCYLPSLDDRLRTVTELHEAIDREFKAAGIEIAFPQRDLHVRALPPPSGLDEFPKQDDVFVQRPEQVDEEGK